MSGQYRAIGAQSSRKAPMGLRINRVQKVRRNSSCRKSCNFGPYGTAARPADSAKPMSSGGTAMLTSCPRRDSSHPTLTDGSTSPRVP
ncbi:Uncharacterised protein [Mycobacteroides abscessus subsp. abscessus]|nr:Uncharacterised protein [Mycobacteroides abscessus subsp. abscessus]